MAKHKKDEDWMTRQWRPMMGWTYMATVLFDFILGPVLYNILQYYNPGQAVGMWTPLTLQGGGMYHIAMGAIIGVSAFGRTQEKLAVTNAPDPVPVQPVMMPQPAQNFGGGMMGGYVPASSFGEPAPVYAPAPAPVYAPAPSFGEPTPTFDTTANGKKIIPDQQQPEL